MAQTTFSIRMDESLKRQFDALCGDFGMNMTTAFTTFARAVVRERAIPFRICADPNPETLAAIDDVRNGREMSRIFHSVDELMEDLDA